MVTTGSLVTLSKLGNSESAKIAKKYFLNSTDSKLSRKLLDFRKNAEWLAKHRESLRKKYGDMYVAISKKDVCYASPSHAKVIAHVRKEYGYDPAVLIDYIGKQKVKFLL